MLTTLRRLWLRIRRPRTPQPSATTARHRTMPIRTAWLHTAAHPADVDRIRYPIGRAAVRRPVNRRG